MRIMAIDYGDARTGLAISDPTGVLTGPVKTIVSRKREEAAKEICAVVREYNVALLVLGYPKNMNDTLGDRAKKSEEFAVLLREESGLPVVLWDERRTTVDAHRILSQQGVRGKKRKAKVDALAAALILEGFLAYRKEHKEEDGEGGFH
ncbi:MAG: Holliday junction resolvase RuvX [Oscillospiraceae bacterium]|nr:Holliday junction resolvase RuvX [Oscillospiraceae bacterium]